MKPQDATASHQWSPTRMFARLAAGSIAVMAAISFGGILSVLIAMGCAHWSKLDLAPNAYDHVLLTRDLAPPPSWGYINFGERRCGFGIDYAEGTWNFVDVRGQATLSTEQSIRDRRQAGEDVNGLVYYCDLKCLRVGWPFRCFEVGHLVRRINSEKNPDDPASSFYLPREDGQRVVERLFCFAYPSRILIARDPIWSGIAANAAILATGPLVAYGGLRFFSYILRWRKGLCPGCGYPKEGLALCPECGRVHSGNTAVRHEIATTGGRS